jgi:hypothetical protein
VRRAPRSINATVPFGAPGRYKSLSVIEHSITRILPDHERVEVPSDDVAMGASDPVFRGGWECVAE